ncbi:hypothetical protein QF034_004391 [Streptomyces africanus]|uniref:Uncharacterized protein n=1 Tax=Streptomyces africanus TaxID=231024 RepID=A0ABU0QT50_9ACTN|nr:hypothetical protein [Streptomyces africanus]MDQ0750160.1 hypothetical protein [Streptomyces africanus]
MGLFRKRRERWERRSGDEPHPYVDQEQGRSADDAYVLLRDGAGELEGLWIGDVRQADDDFIGAVLARHGLGDDVTTSRYRVVHNTFNDRGGVFVRFVGDASTAGAGAPPRRELVVGDRHCPVHEDFDAFSRDAAAGDVALLKTTIDAASAGDLYPLYQALSERFGDQAPQARAAMRAALQCATCLRLYPASLIHLRDMKREGRPMAGTVSSEDGARQVNRALAMTACLDCGGEVAVWVYNPHVLDESQ